MRSAELPASSEIIAFHDHRVASTGWEPKTPIEANHWHNCMLWEQEDLARRRNVPDSEIAGNKRAIDSHNQKRNDSIERIDEGLLEVLEKVKRKPGARLNSETAGAMIDRLSILALKIHHMRLQTERADVDREHIESCRERLVRLIEQRADLAGCLDRLLLEAQRGEAYFKIYRQFKMYNDPKLNPALYGRKR
jgi:hypothetical protein